MEISRKQMVVGVKYVVTKPSQHREFMVGDIIKLFDDGGIGNYKIGGIMRAEDVPSASKGMKCELLAVNL